METRELAGSHPGCKTTHVGLAFFLAEYEVLRREIDVYHGHQKDIINWAIGIAVALVVGAIPSLPLIKPEFAFLFLALPFVYLILASMYCDRTLRIVRVADYLHNDLGKKIRDLFGEDLLQWETYKQTTKIFGRFIPLVFDRLRWFMFLLPSVFSIVVFTLAHQLPWKWYEVVLLVAGIASVLLAGLLWIIVEETRGVRSKSTIPPPTTGSKK